MVDNRPRNKLFPFFADQFFSATLDSLKTLKYTILDLADPNFIFPVPKIENVYQAWKPIDYGHPLVDATIHYAPPELERVHIGRGPVPPRPPSTNKNLVFEDAREVDGHKDEKLKAKVYVSPKIDNPYQGD